MKSNLQVSMLDMLYEDVILHKLEKTNGIRAAVSWSGGKDSTATAILAINDGYEVYMANAFVEFAEGIPFVSKRMVEFIYQAKEKFESYGAKVELLKGMTYVDFCRRVRIRSRIPGRNGKMVGYPSPTLGHCEYQNYIKSEPLTKWQKKINADETFIGIGYDEIARQGQLNGKKRSLLCERKYTQAAAKEICRLNGLLSPVYETGSRDGCVLCYNNRNPARIKEWLNDYPEALPILRELDDELKKNGEHGNTWGRGDITLYDIGIL